MKTSICEMKNTWEGNNGKLDTAQEKIMEDEDRVTEAIQNETHNEKRLQKYEKSSVSHETASRSLLKGKLESLAGM